LGPKLIVMRCHILLVLAVMMGIIFPSMKAFGARSFQMHPGYLENVTGERNEIVEDVIVFAPPSDGKPELRAQIFDDKLTREFTDRYHAKFGYTEQQRAYLAPNQHTYYQDQMSYRGTAEETDAEKARFGEFMVRKLAEYHLENYMKKDPKTRAVWAVKERVTNASMAIGKGIKVSAKYNIAGKSADFALKNPWVDAKVVMILGSGKSAESVFTLSRPITKTVTAESHYKFEDNVVVLVGKKALSPMLTTSLTASTYTKNEGLSRRESVYLAGLTFIY
jgi:hypothetical protein